MFWFFLYQTQARQKLKQKRPPCQVNAPVFFLYHLCFPIVIVQANHIFYLPNTNRLTTHRHGEVEQVVQEVEKSNDRFPQRLKHLTNILIEIIKEIVHTSHLG